MSREVSGRVNLTNLTKYYVTKENMDKVGEVFTPGKLVTCAVERLENSKRIFLILLNLYLRAKEKKLHLTFSFNLKFKKR